MSVRLMFLLAAVASALALATVAFAVDPVGGVRLGGTTPPDPREMARGEARIWVDPAPVTGGLRVTIRFSDGSSVVERLTGPRPNVGP